jgi:hypothetical protein
MGKESKKVVTPRLGDLRGRTPYDRPSPATPSRSITTDDPPVSRSLFSRVKDIFSPAKLSPARLFGINTPSTRPTEMHEEDIIMDEKPEQSMKIQNDSIGNVNTQGVFSFPPPRQPYIESTSPNLKLMEFFREKGTEELSEMEVEGVLSLLNQAKSKDTSPVTSTNLPAQLELTMSMSGPHGEDIDGEIYSSPMRHEPKTRKIHISTESPVSYSPLYTPPRKKSQPGTPFSRSSMHYHDIPTPYRPGSRPKQYRQRSVPSAPAREQTHSPAEPDTRQDEVQERPLSETASALLSLLGDSDEPETVLSNEPTTPRIVKQHVNPHRSQKRQMTSPASKPAEHRKTAIEELETTKPRNGKPEVKSPVSVCHAPSPAFSSVNKYKPAHPSGLRKSIVVSSSPQPTKTPLEPTQPSRSSGPATFSPSMFTLNSETPKPKSLFASVDETPSSGTMLSPARPLYPTAKDKLTTSTMPLMQSGETNVQVHDESTHLLDYKQLFQFPDCVPVDTEPRSIDEKLLEAAKALFQF